MGKLTAKQEAFCLEYLKDLNAAQAAIRAGYSKKTAQQMGSENLAKPVIAEKITILKAERAERTRIDADWVLKSAKQVFDRCMQREDVLNRDGTPVIVQTEAGELAAAYKFEHAGANKALEIIGKHVDVRAFDVANSESEKEASPLVINFAVSNPVGDIKVTQGEDG
jgi:phage terminase small subunit